MKEFGRLIIFFVVTIGVIIYLYLNHWEKFYPLFGYGILMIVFLIVLIGISALLAYLANANKNANFEVFKFTRTFLFMLICFAIAAPIFWFSEPLIYKSISTTIGERIMPDWYFEFFEREKPEFAPIEYDKRDLF